MPTIAAGPRNFVTRLILALATIASANDFPANRWIPLTAGARRLDGAGHRHADAQVAIVPFEDAHHSHVIGDGDLCDNGNVANLRLALEDAIKCVVGSRPRENGTSWFKPHPIERPRAASTSSENARARSM